MDLKEKQVLHQEARKANQARLEHEYKNFQEQLYSILARKNNFAANKLPEGVLAIHLQALSVAAEVGALVDTLESMGRIDRVDFTAQCVNRLRKLVEMFQLPN